MPHIVSNQDKSVNQIFFWFMKVKKINTWTELKDFKITFNSTFLTMENILDKYFMEIKTELKIIWPVSNMDREYFSIQMETHILVLGNKTSLMVKEFICLQQEKFTKDYLENPKNMAEELITTKMRLLFIQEHGKMIWSMEQEFLILHNCIMKVNGKKESNTEMDMKKINSIILFMLVNTMKELNKEKEELFIKMAVFMQENLLMKFPMELEIFSIQIRTNTSDNFLKEKNMEKETTFSAKAQFLVDVGRKTKNLKANWLCLTEIYSMDVSKIIKDIKENIDTEMVIFMKEPGKMM